MDGYYSELGLFTICSKIEKCARYVKSRGMIPVVHLTKSHRSFYSNFANDDIWQKFFEQPEGYSYDAVLKSKNVFFSSGFYNGSIQSHIMDCASKDIQLTWSQGLYNDKVKEFIRVKQAQFLPYPDQNIVSIKLLAECHSLIASGGCSGLEQVLKENGGNYQNTYILDLELNS